MSYLRTGFLLSLLTMLLACSHHTTHSVRTTNRITAGGTQYTLFYPDSLMMQVVTSRPDPASSPTQLSIAAAYTDLQTNRPLDLLTCQGRVLQTTAKVGYLDGLLTLLGDSLTITHLAKGKQLSSDRLAYVRRQHGTLLLQELLVYQGQNQRGPGGSRFQRRALVEFAPRRFAVVESVADTITMQQFAADLVSLGARTALYLDMGDWDEGWYKTEDKVITLGHRRTETPRQSNWLVFIPKPAIPE